MRIPLPFSRTSVGAALLRQYLRRCTPRKLCQKLQLVLSITSLKCCSLVSYTAQISTDSGRLGGGAALVRN